MSCISVRLVRVILVVLACAHANAASADHTGGAAGGGGFGSAAASAFARDSEIPTTWLEYRFEVADLDLHLGELLTHNLQASYAFGGEERRFALRSALPIFHLLSDVEDDAYGNGDLSVALWWNALRGDVHAHAQDGSAGRRWLAYSVNLGLTGLAPIGDSDRDFSADAWGNGVTVAGTVRAGDLALIASGGLSWLYEGPFRPTISWSAGPAVFLWDDRVTLLATLGGAHVTSSEGVFRPGGYRLDFTPSIEIAPFPDGPLRGLSFGAGLRLQVRDKIELTRDPVPLTEPDLRADRERTGVFTIRYSF